MVAVSVGSMEKELPQVPTVILPEPSLRKTSKKHVILTSWASVTTALLLLILVGGAFYVADLKSRECTDDDTSEHDTTDYSRTYDDNGKKTQEDIHLDKDDQTQLMIKKDENGNIEMITAEDHKKKISATYIPADDVCLVAAGVDMDWLDDVDSEETDMTQDDVEEDDYKVSGNRVTDLSILPRAVKELCEGKDNYWVQPADKDEIEKEMEEGMESADGTGREKRSACCCRGCWKWKCSGWGRRRHCYRYFSTSWIGCGFRRDASCGSHCTNVKTRYGDC